MCIYTRKSTVFNSEWQNNKSSNWLLHELLNFLVDAAWLNFQSKAFLLFFIFFFNYDSEVTELFLAK